MSDTDPTFLRTGIASSVFIESKFARNQLKPLKLSAWSV